MDPIKPTPIEAVPTTLHQQGWAVVEADALQHWLHTDSASLAPIRDSWSDLPPDNFLRDGGRYRFRRHSSFIVDPAAGTTTQVPHRPHWQPVTYNALHGGIQRHFEPIEPALVADPLWTRWLAGMAARASALRGPRTWYVEAHPFRIDTTDGRELHRSAGTRLVERKQFGQQGPRRHGSDALQCGRIGCLHARASPTGQCSDESFFWVLGNASVMTMPRVAMAASAQKAASLAPPESVRMRPIKSGPK